MLFTDRVRQAVIARRRWCRSTAIISAVATLIIRGGDIGITCLVVVTSVLIVWSITTDTVKREESKREL